MRCIDVEKLAAAGDNEKVNRIRSQIRGMTGSYPNPYPSPYSTNTPTTSLSPQFASPTPKPPPSMPSYPIPNYTPNRMIYKTSPFYTILKPLAPTQELKAREQTRDTARITFMLDLQTAELLQRDPNTRVMVFCAVENYESRHVPCDITFPQHGELKCNSDDVKSNLKGLKNKPGTTRPADVTTFIRKKINFPNTIELVYALTTKVRNVYLSLHTLAVRNCQIFIGGIQETVRRLIAWVCPVQSSSVRCLNQSSRAEQDIRQKYYLTANLVQKKPVDSLLADLRRGKYISKDRVIKESEYRSRVVIVSLINPVQTKASDPDIVATSSVMSLKDPVQMTRIETPCRSIACRHNECFDAAAYLNLQEQAPTWTCPCCNRSAPWENLVFDQYFDDILRNVSNNVDQVTVDPDGKWHIGDTQKPNNQQGQNQDSDDDDDDDDNDLVMLPDPRSSSRDFIRTPNMAGSPSFSGPSTMTSTAPYSAGKRKHAETIDLTIDDSDDDQPPRPPPKRSNTSMSSGFSFSNQYQSPPMPTPYRFQLQPPSSSSNNYHPNGFYPG